MTKFGFTASILLAWAVAAALRYPIADIALERDEGEYAYIAQHWTLGDVPYRDSFDQKPPGTFAAYVVILKLFGESPAAIHWGAQVYTFATLACLIAVGRRVFGPAAGAAAGILAAWLTSDPFVLGNAANTETLMILPLTAGLLATLHAVERGSAGWAFVAGVCATLAVLCKQVAAPHVLLQIGIVAALGRPRVKLLAALAAGGVAVLVPVLGYFAAVGALGEFYDCVLGHNFAYAGRIPLWAYPLILGATLKPMLWSWGPVFALAAVGWAFPGDVPRPRLAFWWLLASLAGTSAGGYYRQHYFIQLIPPLAALAGCGMASLLRGLVPADRFGLTCVGALFVAAYGVGYSQDYYALDDTPLRKCRSLYWSNPFSESLPVGAWLRERTAPDERIFVFGSEPQILFYAARPSATRYIFAYPLMTGFADALARQDEVVAALERAPPRFVVYVAEAMSFLRDPTAPSRLETWLDAELARSYRFVAFALPESPVVHEVDPAAPATTMAMSLLIYERRPPRDAR